MLRRRAPFTLVLVLVLALAAVPASSALAATGATKATNLVVRAMEFKFTLSRSSVRKGPVTFTVENVGKLSHDFKIAGKKTPLISPGKSAVLKVTFTKAGKYPYLCTVPGHAAAGMKGTLTVSG